MRPRTRAVTLQRPRLVGHLRDAAGIRLALVVAGPGTGKTTMLSQLPASRVAWHTVTPDDDDPVVLLRSIVDALRDRLDHVPHDLLLGSAGAPGPSASGPDEGRLARIAAELAQGIADGLEADLWLVLDDVDRLRSGGAGESFIADLCRAAPRRLHLVVSSRRAPGFPIARMRLEGELLELGTRDLAFTTAELAQLLQRVGRAPALADPLRNQTGGWPAAASFAVQVLGRDRDVGVEELLASDASVPLFDYLAQEVVAAERPADLAALRRAAHLPWLTAAMVADLGPPEASTDLFDPDDPGIYVVRATGHPKAVELTPLVRDFLTAQHPLTDPERHELLTEAARWYADRDAIPEALACHRARGDLEAIEALLAEHGSTLLAAGHARTVRTAIAALPESSTSARIRLLDAECRQVLGDWEGALRVYEALVPGTGPTAPGVAWRLGFLHHMQGRTDQALAAYERGRLDDGAPADEAALLGWTASAHWLRGDRDQARRLAHEAHERALVADDPGALATAHTVLALVAALDSDRAANDWHYLRALDHAEAAHDVLQTIRIRSNRGSHFMEEGAHARALEELEVALRLADLTGFELWRALALANRGQVLARVGRLDEAAADLRESQSVFHRLGSDLEAYPLIALGSVHATRGTSALARAALEQAVTLAERAGDRQALVAALAGLSRVLVDDDVDTAIVLSDRAVGIRDVLGHVDALVSSGRAALATGDRETALERAGRAASLARSRRDLPGLAEVLRLQADATVDTDDRRGLLEQAGAVFDEVRDPVGRARVDLALAELEAPALGAELAIAVGGRFEQLGAKGPAQHARAVAARLADRPAVTAIQTLGRLGLSHDGVAIAEDAWQSQVARDVLGMLVANRGRPLHREVVIERLWPDVDPARASNRLSVALSTIRRLVDPDDRHDRNHHVTTTRETVTLRLDTTRVDVEDFLGAARTGLDLLRQGARDRGLPHLRAAEAAYVGDFLEDRPYADWAVALREEARATYLAAAGALADAEAAVGDHDQAARRWLRMLERDPHNERAHLGVIQSMVAAGHHGAARRLHALYVARMDEIDVEPASFPGT